MTRRWRIRTTFVAGALCLGVLATAVAVAALTSGDGGKPQMASSTNPIRLEHVALNVAEPVKMAQWYVDHLGMKVVREGPAPANTRFLADSGDNMMLEVYHNPPEAVPDYAAMDPLILHVAFMVEDVDAVRAKLLAAGATAVGEITVTPAGDRIAMLRDPWGLAIQFLRRADPMLPRK